MKSYVRWLAVAAAGTILVTLVILSRRASVRERARVARFEADVRYACSHCHACPEPQGIPQSLWRKEVEQAYSFIAGSDIDSLRVPPMEQTVAYFESHAPQKWPLSPQLLNRVPADESGFHVRHIDADSEQTLP